MKTNIQAGLCALSLAFLSACQTEQSNTQSSNANTIRSENFISVDTANKMINSYLNSIKTGDTNQIYSFIVQADDLRSYLSDSNIKGLKIMLAHPLEYINGGNEGIPGGLSSSKLTVVFGGFDIEGNYVLSPDGKVPNKTIVCPPLCPVIGSAANNTFD